MAPTRQMETERSIRRDRVTAEAKLGHDGCTLGTMSSKARGRRNDHAHTIEPADAAAGHPRTSRQRAAPNGSQLRESSASRCGGRVDLGGRPPRSPTDPDVQLSRIRFLE
jgi:hypothetical protein